MNEMTTLDVESHELTQQANLYIVKNQETYDGAAILKKSLSAFKLKLKTIFDPIVSTANTAYKEAKSQQKAQVNPIEEAEKILRQKCKDYEDEKEKERLALEQKEKDKAAQAVKDAEEFSEAQGLDDEGDMFGNKMEQQPPPPVKVKPTFEKQTGLGIRRTWKYKVIDEALIPTAYLKPDLVKIGEAVRKNKDTIPIPGIEVYYD